MNSNIPQNTGPKLDSTTLGKVSQEMLNLRQPPQVNERPLPEKFRHVISVDWFRTFSWKERLLIALGYNLAVYIRVPTRHNPASLQPVIGAEVSHHLNAESAVKEQLDHVLEEAKNE